MSLIVQKFGGSSVANTNRILNVANIVTDTYKAGNRVVVVVSAQGDTTDELIEKATEINPDPSKREMDVLLSTGEQISMSLLAMAIEKLGFPIVSLTGWQVGMQTDSKYSSARIKALSNTERIQTELDRRNIVIVAGFQGINKYEDITTLGRGGSDTTAVALAAALGAELCQIYTDVDGVYTTDPRIVTDAKKIEQISCDEMLELASLGAGVLHSRSVELAKKFNVNLEVLSSFTRQPGTRVKEGKSVEKVQVRGVTKDTNIARIAIVGVPDKPGVAFRVFSMLAKKNISVDIILQSIGRDETKDISFTVAKTNLRDALAVLEQNNGTIEAKSVESDDNVSKVSIVGAGIVNHAGIAATMFETLFDAGVNIQMISTSEIKISVLVADEDANRAVKAIHDKFNLGE